MRGSLKKPPAESPPPELQLLIVCTRTRLEGTLAAQLRALVGAGPDWEEVLKGARHHGVMPLLNRHLSGLGAPSVPAPVLGELSGYARKNAVHNLALSHALLELLDTLKQQGVEAVPYKGAVLASSAYGDLSLRSFNDLDIIVQPKDFGRASSSLSGLGYALSDNNPDEHFHETFVHSETGVSVELHHDVIRRRYFPTPLSLSTMWDGLTQSTLLGRPVASFSPEDTLLLLCLHGSSHAWQGLTWIADVSEFVRAHPGLEWELVLQKAAQARISRIVLLGLHLAHTVLAAPLPEGVQRVLNADPVLSKLSQKIVTRMHKKRGPLGEAVLTQQLQLAMRSGRLKVPLYIKFVTFLLRPNARPLRRIRHYLISELRVVSKKRRA